MQRFARQFQPLLPLLSIWLVFLSFFFERGSFLGAEVTTNQSHARTYGYNRESLEEGSPLKSSETRFEQTALHSPPFLSFSSLSSSRPAFERQGFAPRETTTATRIFSPPLHPRAERNLGMIFESEGTMGDKLNGGRG